MKPAYYKSLSLRNFRGFKKADNIPLAPVTFLVGPNSSGKSSISNALLFLAQSNVYPPFEIPVMPEWTGSFVDIGSYEDMVYRHDVSLTTSIAAELLIEPNREPVRPTAGRHPVKFEFRMRASKKHHFMGYISSIHITDVFTSEKVTISFRPTTPRKYRLKFLDMTDVVSIKRYFAEEMTYQMLAEKIVQSINRLKKTARGRKALHGRRAAWRRIINQMRSLSLMIFSVNTQRVSSGRANPERNYPVVSLHQPRAHLRSLLGELLDRVSPEMLLAIESRTLKKGRSRLGKKLPPIDTILKELDIASNIKTKTISHYHSQIEVKDNVTKVVSNLIDVGFGASQVLPVIAACFSNSPGPLIVEQPEIHLHPKAQGTISELLCLTGQHRQVLVETHSVHMINRARLLVAEGRLNYRDVIINYISRDADGSHVHIIPIKENGDFGADWPQGFFDERYDDTMTLLQLQSDKESD